MTPNDCLDLMIEISDFLDNYVDVNDGDDGQPVPNRAMRLKSAVDDVIQTLEREVTA